MQSGIISPATKSLCSREHPVAKRLHAIMREKQSNLCVAADVQTKAEFLSLVDAIGPSICVLKTHIDIIKDFDADLLIQLKKKAARYNFLIFEDRKFADIGSTNQAQFSAGIFAIADWADMVNAHALAGPGVIEGIAQACPECAILLVAQLSCKGSLIDQRYTQQALAMGYDSPESVIGFIAQDCVVKKPFLKFTPGVNLAVKGDSLGQQYKTPDYLIGKLGADVIIVGRGVYQATDPAQAAHMYKVAGWNACANKS